MSRDKKVWSESSRSGASFDQHLHGRAVFRCEDIVSLLHELLCHGDAAVRALLDVLRNFWRTNSVSEKETGLPTSALRVGLYYEYNSGNRLLERDSCGLGRGALVRRRQIRSHVPSSHLAHHMSADDFDDHRKPLLARGTLQMAADTRSCVLPYQLLGEQSGR